MVELVVRMEVEMVAGAEATAEVTVVEEKAAA